MTLHSKTKKIEGFTFSADFHFSCSLIVQQVSGNFIFSNFNRVVILQLDFETFGES